MKYSANKLIDNLLESLNERQREVLVGRFGLGKSGKSETLASLGARYRVTRERVRQIEAGALNKLKKESVKTDLKDFVNLVKNHLKNIFLQ